MVSLASSFLKLFLTKCMSSGISVSAGTTYFAGAWWWWCSVVDRGERETRARTETCQVILVWGEVRDWSHWNNRFWLRLPVGLFSRVRQRGRPVNTWWKNWSFPLGATGFARLTLFIRRQLTCLLLGFLFPQLMQTGHLSHLNRIQQYFDARENTKMLLWKPQRVQLFPGDDMKPIELQEMVIVSYLWRKRAGSEWNRYHCVGSFCLWKSPSSVHKIRLSTNCKKGKGGPKTLALSYPYLFSSFVLGLGSRAWWLRKTGACSALESGRGRDVSCSPPLHCSSWKPAAFQ